MCSGAIKWQLNNLTARVKKKSHSVWALVAVLVGMVKVKVREHRILLRRIGKMVMGRCREVAVAEGPVMLVVSPM